MQLRVWGQCYPRKILQFLPSFKLTQNCYINMNIFFLENWQFNHKLDHPFSCKHTVPERISSQFNKIWNQGDFKNLNFPTLKNLKNLEVYIHKTQFLIFFMNWEKLCPNLSFTVEKKVVHLRKCSHFKLNIMNEVFHYLLKFKKFSTNW